MDVVSAPKVQNYRDYRDFLSDWFKAGKATNKRMSFRYVARHLELKSPNHFHLVITKKRHFSKRTLERMQIFLHLRPKERAYLDLLFALSQAESAQKRDEIEAKVTRLGAELGDAGVSYQQYALLANSLAWYLKIGALRFTGKTGDEIARLVAASCPFAIECRDVGAALDLLVKNGAARLADGTYTFDFDNLKTEWDFEGQKIKQFHHNNLLLAAQAIPWPINKRFLSNVTIPCNAELFETAKKEIRDLCLKLLNLSNQLIATAEDCQKVVSLQFAMFPYFVFDDSSHKILAAADKGKAATG